MQEMRKEYKFHKSENQKGRDKGLGRPRHRWQNIKMEPKEIGHGECGLDSAGSGLLASQDGPCSMVGIS